ELARTRARAGQHDVRPAVLDRHPPEHFARPQHRGSAGRCAVAAPAERLRTQYGHARTPERGRSGARGKAPATNARPFWQSWTRGMARRFAGVPGVVFNPCHRAGRHGFSRSTPPHPNLGPPPAPWARGETGAACLAATLASAQALEIAEEALTGPI